MIGLDIGTKFIKICQVEKQGNTCRIAAAAIAINPGIQPDTPKPYALVTARIRAVMKDAHISGRTVAAAVAGQNVVTRSFSFPALSRQELDGAVALEASQSLPSNTAPMYSDYLVMPADYDGKKDVLFAGTPCTVIDTMAMVSRGAGLDLTIVDIDNIAMTNCFLALEPGALKESVILINIGHTQTNLAIVDAGELRFVRNVTFGGREITRNIAATLGISEDLAEELKKNPQLWKEIGFNIKDILRRSLPDLLEAIYRSIEYCMNRKKLVCVDRILLTGGASALAGLSEFIKEALGIATDRWNPLAKMNIPHKAVVDSGHYFAVGIGLGLRESSDV